MDGDGELNAEELWLLLEELVLDMTPEKYYELLQTLDQDGSCSVGMDAFVEYYTESLGGLVLQGELKKGMKNLRLQEEIDPVEHAIALWRESDIGKQGTLAPEDAVQMFTKLNVECQPREVEQLCKEFEVDDGMLHMDDFVSLFAPNIAMEEVYMCERKKLVNRVVSILFQWRCEQAVCSNGGTTRAG